MNGLDVAIAAAAFLGALYGLSRGALRMLTSVLALVAAIYLAYLYYPRAAQIAGRELALGSTAAAVLGYVVIFLAVVVAIEIAGHIVGRLIRTIHLSWIDRLIGAAIGAGIALLLIGLVLLLLRPLQVTDAPLVKHSELAQDVMLYTDEWAGFVPAGVTRMAPAAEREIERQRRELESTLVKHALSSPSAVPSR